MDGNEKVEKGTVKKGEATVIYLSPFVEHKRNYPSRQGYTIGYTKEE